MKTYNVLGLMSGSSLDGLDIAHCEFAETETGWTYKILDADVVDFPSKWKLRLRNLVMQNAITYLKTDIYFGHFIGETINHYINENDIRDELDFVAWHGQTIFHQPENNLTSQVGSGAAVAEKSGMPVICDFRSNDVALGGQGAPMVPIGDKYLFPEHKFCLNLGGISNISCKTNDRIIGYDTCIGNIVLNSLANKMEMEYDKGGALARTGEVNADLLREMNSSWYYDKDYPKSLSGGWVRKVMMPVLKKFNISTEDKLATSCEHIAKQIAHNIEIIYDRENVDKEDTDTMLISGGGAFNTFLVERISEHSPVKTVVPSDDIVNFKEAIALAFAGILRTQNKVNLLSSVTGSSQDNIGGVIYQSAKKQY